MWNSNPETPYVKACVPIWVKLYKEGYNGKELAKLFNVNPTTVYRHLHKHIKVRPKSYSKLAENNPMWAGSKVGYSGLHEWVKQRMPKPAKCVKCKIRPALDLANTSHKYNSKTYTRELKNWRWLCRKCHMTEDGRMDNMYHGGPKPKHIGCSVKECIKKHEALGYCSKHYQRYRSKKYAGISL